MALHLSLSTPSLPELLLPGQSYRGRSLLRLLSALLPLLALVVIQPAAAEDPSLLPLYGNIKKTPEQIATDEQFRRDAVKASGSAERGAMLMVAKGFEAIAEKDADTAVKRFNQAWLLKPEIAEIYWGLASAQSLRGKDAETLTLFSRARSLDPTNAELLTDLAFAEMRYATHVARTSQEGQKHLSIALEALSQATTANSKYELAYTNWALALAMLQRPQEAWEKVFQAEALGGKSLDPKFLADLDKMLPRKSAYTRAALRSAKPR